VTSTVVKSAKDSTRPEAVAASDPDLDPPRFAQIFSVEEGPLADQVIDVTKFQNFVITLLLLVAYVALSISTLRHTGAVGQITSLPTFPAAFLTLLGISHAGYIGGKLPSSGGVLGPQAAAGALPGVPAGGAPGLTVANLRGVSAGSIQPRNRPRRRQRGTQPQMVNAGVSAETENTLSK
jgi:hypothetical protein